MTKSVSRGIQITLQSAATTGNGIVIAIPSSFKNHKVIVKGSAGVSAGAIQIETADAPDYAGTWAAQGSPITVVASAEVKSDFEGVFLFLRARISTTVADGTVTVIYVGS